MSVGSSLREGELLYLSLGGDAVFKGVVQHRQNAGFSRFMKRVLRRRFELDVGRVEVFHFDRLKMECGVEVERWWWMGESECIDAVKRRHD